MVVEDVYAQSLFELAKEDGKLDLIYSQMRLAFDNVFSHEDFCRVMSSPKVSFGEKKGILLKVFSNADLLLVRFLIVLLQKGRFSLVVSVAKSFFDMYFGFKNLIRVKVTSAVGLSDNSLDRLKKVLSDKYSSDVVVDNVVNEDIIGGYVVEVGETVVDMSVRTRLDGLRKRVCLIDY